MQQNKQEYQKPVVEVVTVDSNDIICSSFSGPSISGLNNGGSLN